MVDTVKLIESRNAQISGKSGLDGQQMSKYYLKEYANAERRKQQNILSAFVKVENNACKTNNVHQLLSKKWSESQNSYRIMSNIDHELERRIKRVID